MRGGTSRRRQGRSPVTKDKCRRSGHARSRPGGGRGYRWLRQQGSRPVSPPCSREQATSRSVALRSTSGGVARDHRALDPGPPASLAIQAFPGSGHAGRTSTRQRPVPSAGSSALRPAGRAAKSFARTAEPSIPAITAAPVFAVPLSVLGVRTTIVLATGSTQRRRRRCRVLSRHSVETRPAATSAPACLRVR